MTEICQVDGEAKKCKLKKHLTCTVLLLLGIYYIFIACSSYFQGLMEKALLYGAIGTMWLCAASEVDKLFLDVLSYAKNRDESSRLTKTLFWIAFTLFIAWLLRATLITPKAIT